MLHQKLQQGHRFGGRGVSTNILFLDGIRIVNHDIGWKRLMNTGEFGHIVRKVETVAKQTDRQNENGEL